MKVLDLHCSQQHSFEGWFASENDFQDQLARGLVACPMCSDTAIQKLPSAPRLNFGSRRDPEASSTLTTSEASDRDVPKAPAEAPEHQPEHQMPMLADPKAQAGFLKALRKVIANTEDVGERFAMEARRMHYGDAEARSIRGKASVQETVELLEEGIDVMPLPMADAVKETLQ